MILGYGGGLLNRQLIYQTDLPSFQRDFASLKTLNHGTGPDIAFTRTTTGTYFDVNGAMQTAAIDAPRFDHDPATGASLGLLVEMQRTNSLPNSVADGAVAGSPGTFPTAWSHATGGLTANIASVGTEDGMAFVDIQLVGTTSGTSTGIRFSTTTATTASSGQTWTCSLFARTVGGATTNLTSIAVNIFGRTAANAATADSNSSSSIASSLSADSLRKNRVSHTFALADATTERVNGQLLLGHLAGSSIDITLRIAAPQMELGAFATSFIPTTDAAATRGADNAIVTPANVFYNPVEGTMFAEARESGLNTLFGVMSLDDNSATNRIDLRRPGSTQLRMLITNAGAAQASMDVTYAAAAQTFKIAGVYKADDAAVTVNGGSLTTDTSLTLPTLTHLSIGALGATGGGITNRINGHIRKVAYWPKRLTDALIQQLAT
jgi:hypothetical protein